MAEVGASVGVEVVKCAAAPLGRQFCYIYSYATYIEKLRQQARDLNDAKTSVQHQVDEAERQGDEIEDDVRHWLNDVACKGAKVDQIIRGDESAGKCCFFGLCPNLKTRYRFGRKAAKTTAELAELMEKKNFDRVSYAPAAPVAPKRNAPTYVAYESRSSCLEEIIKALKDPAVNMVGVYGMGGIGKTTLLHQVAKEVEATKIFQLAVIATVKQNPDLKTIQEEIARQLDLVFPLEMSEEDRRSRIWHQLKKSEAVLVILDDLWANFDYDAAGIPFGKNHEGCKLLLASRFKDELSEMGTQREIPIGFLKYPEDWDLFKKMADNSVEGDPDTQIIAREVVEVCSGLPIAIVTIARALKNKPLFVWKDALIRLKRPIPTGPDMEKMKDVAYQTIELSYNHLESEELKFFFLLCATFGNTVTMSDIIKYAVGLGFFEDIQTMEAAHNRVCTLEIKLIASCLLLECDFGSCAMHDFVRDVGIAIAFRDRKMLTVRDDALEELPMKDNLKCCTSIALFMANLRKLPEDLVLPRLELLFISVPGNKDFTAPDSIFKGMPNLKVLGLTGMKFPGQLPASIQVLESLQTLCLDQCLLGDIAMVGELRNLQIFSIVHSEIEKLPEELGKLAKLRLLDFRGCTKLKSIPSNTLARLTKLETLYIGDSFAHWDEEGPNASLAELKGMLHLTDLQIHFQDVKTLPQDFFFKHLQRHKIYVGGTWKWSDFSVDNSSRILKIKDDTDVNVAEQQGIKKLIEETEVLFLDNLRTLTNICYGLVREGFVRLKHLNIQNSHDVQYIIDDGKKVPLLEILELSSLHNLEQIYHGQGRAFDKLREIKVKCCRKLKNLFSFPRDKSVLRIQSIEVVDCEVLEGIIEEEESMDNNVNNNSSTTIKFTELRSMSLVDLPKLISFGLKVKKKGEFDDTMTEPESDVSWPLFNGKVLFPDLETLDVDGISANNIWHCSFGFQNLRSLKIKRCGNLKYLLTSSIARHLVELRELKIHGCDILEEIVLRDDGEEDKANVVVFGKLEQLELHYLPNLKRFIVGRSLRFPYLRRLSIQFCDKLEVMAQDDKNSGEMRVAGESQCYSLFNGKVSFPLLEFFFLHRSDNLKTIWSNQLEAQSFGNLRKFRIFSCDSLQTLFAKEKPNVVGAQSEELFLGSSKFEKLHSVNIQSCADLKSVFPASVAKSLKELRALNIFHCKELEEIIEKDKEEEMDLISYFPNLNSLILRELPKLKCHCLKKHSPEWISLERLFIEHCHQVDIFGSQTKGYHLDFQISFEKVFPKLKSLSLDSQSINFLQHQEHPVSFFRSITELNLVCFHEELDEFPLSFLKRFQNLSTLWVNYSSFKEIFSSKGLGEEEQEGALGTLRYLQLLELQELKHVCTDDSFSHSILKQLEDIFIWKCNGLLTLVPPTVSIQNLKTLVVRHCAGLKRLISFSTARSLVQLTTLDIRHCKSMEEIVATEDNYKGEIVFEKLTFMNFGYLQNLQSFCNGGQTFKFPSLKKVIVFECAMMKYFSQGHSSSPKLKGVQLGMLEGDKNVWKGDLNSTIQNLYLDKKKDVEQDEDGDDASETKEEE